MNISASMARWSSLGCLLLLLSPAVQAQNATLEAIAACLGIEAREARHACYDQAETVAPQLAQPAVAAATPALPTVEEFGKVSASARVEQDEAGKAELVDRIAELREVQHKQWQITLESGQVWRQMLSQTFNLRKGYEVRIAPINDGPNYRLSSPQVAGTIQVRRVR